MPAVLWTRIAGTGFVSNHQKHNYWRWLYRPPGNQLVGINGCQYMHSVAIRSWLLFLMTLLGALPVQAELILSSAPRDTREKEEEIFKPIVDLLTKAVGEKVTFRHGDNFLVYQSEMRKGSYDITLDGAQFVGWRMAKLGHVPLVKFSENLAFVAIARKDQDKIKTSRIWRTHRLRLSATQSGDAHGTVRI